MVLKTETALRHFEKKVKNLQMEADRLELIARHNSQVRPIQPALPVRTTRGHMVDLQLMFFFYPRRAENRAFRPQVTQKKSKKAKNSRNLTREQALVSASASRHPAASLELGAGRRLRS